MNLVVASFVEFLYLLGCKIGWTTLFSFATVLVVDGFVNIMFQADRNFPFCWVEIFVAEWRMV